MKKILMLILMVITFTCSIFISLDKNVIAADTGPKPQTSITFKNLPNQNLEIGFILDHKQDTNHNGEPLSSIGRHIGEKDNYRYLITSTNGESTKTIKWTYISPSQFRFYIYNSSTNDFAYSNEITRYAFEAFYEIDYKAIDFSTNTIDVTSHQVADVTKTIGLFILRLSFTLCIELGIALLFNFSKKSYIVIAVTNIATQIGLNLLIQSILNVHGLEYASYLMYSFLMYSILLILIEVIVFTIECLIYKKFTYSKEGEKGKNGVKYGLIANAAAFILGLILWILI